MARSKSKRPVPGSIADTVAMLAVWAGCAPRGFGHVEYHSEYARAEADRQLGEILLREQVPYHHIQLPVRTTPSQAGRYLLEHLEPIESGAVSITGFATAVAEEDRIDFLGILAGKREVLAEFGLCQIWWMTPDFRDTFLRTVHALDSWFMTRLHLEEEFFPPAGEWYASEPAFPIWPNSSIDGALRRASSLVERFRRAREVGTRTGELIELAASAADAVVEVGTPRLTRVLADQLVSGLTDACPDPLADCLSTARGLNRFARLLVAQGQVKKAAPLIDRARALVEQDERPDHPDVTRDLHDLAWLQLGINRPERAEPLFRRALAIAERAHRPSHLDVAHCLISLATMLEKTRRLKEAEALSRRALAINEKDLGPNHPDVAADLSDLATVLRTAGRLVEAEPLFRRALAIDERCLGPDDPRVAYDLNNLAVLLRAMDEPEEAEPLLHRALAIDERGLGPDHPAVARDLVNLALLLQAGGRFSEAEALLRRALAIDERIYPADHPSVVRDRHHLTSLLEAMNRLDEAGAMLR